MRPAAELGVELALFCAAAVCLVAGFGGTRLLDASSDPGAKPKGALRVVTWNVGGASGRGGHALVREAFDDVVETLRLLDADLLLLQELESSSQAEALRRALGSAEWMLVDAPVRGRTVALLARGGTLIAIDRGPIACRAVYRRRGWPPLTVASAHAHAYSAERRNRELGLLARTLSEDPDHHAILLGGDFNLDLDLDKRRDLFSDDAHRDVETYNFISQRFQDATLGTGSTAEPDRRLDYLFISSGWFRVEAAGPWRGRRVSDMDHDPVFLDLVRSRE